MTPLTTSPHARYWALDRHVAFLNHGSFGACPLPVLEVQRQWRLRLERQPVQFFVRDLESLLDESRTILAEFLGADPQDIAWVSNATHGVNAVLQSLSLRAGDELLTTNHAYNACRNALEFVARRSGARVVVASVSFPLDSAKHVHDAILQAVTLRTRLALIDHVSSPTGLIFPLETLIPALAKRGVQILIDGAHASGMLPLELSALGATYYTGNCHKWMCAPKGVGFLYVQRELQTNVRPTVISHGANSTRTDRSRFLIEFDWHGTHDPSAILSVPEAVRFMADLLPGGWPALRAHNREMVLAGRMLLCRALGIEPPCPDNMIGALASLPLPLSTEPHAARSMPGTDPLQNRLHQIHGVEVPVMTWPVPPHRLIRISAQVYNDLAQYEQLATILLEICNPKR